MTMKENSLLMPLFKTIDKVLFGIEDINEFENKPENADCDNDEEYDVIRSSN